MITKIFNLAIEHYELTIIIFGGIADILARKYPTTKDYSLSSNFNKIMDYFVKNKKKNGGVH